jgi:hypothetical protein
MSTRATITQPSPREYSEWQAPHSTDYRLECCDCGLVHDFQFMAVTKGGKPVDRRKVRIMFRCRRTR